MSYEIRSIKPEEVEAALSLAMEVFLEFEAPEYPAEGVETFRNDIIDNPVFIGDCKNGVCPLYGAFDNGKIIGLIGMRKNKTHINLVFVKKEYHRQGVATALFRHLLTDRLRENPELAEITLNASPYGKAFYFHTGFSAADGEQLTNGIRYTPMKYTVSRDDIPAPCGAVCAACEKYPRECAGCREIRGKVWWLACTGQDDCAFYRCCIQTHGLPHCGKCAAFPCGIFQNGDPTKSAEENAEILRRQTLALKGEE